MYIKFYIWNNMDGPGGYYAGWNKANIRKTNTVWYQVYVDLKKKTIQTKTDS